MVLAGGLRAAGGTQRVLRWLVAWKDACTNLEASIHAGCKQRSSMGVGWVYMGIEIPTKNHETRDLLGRLPLNRPSDLKG